jgi:integrase
MATYRTRTAADGTTTVQVQVRMAGHPAQGATFPNKSEAKKWAATVEAAMIEGRNFKGALGAKRTIAEACERFTREVLPLKRNGSMYGFTLDWWTANHGTKKLGEVSRGWLSDARAQLLTGTFRRATPGSKRSEVTQAAEFQRSPATCNRYMAALSAVFSQACGDWDWLAPAANPFTGFNKLPESKGKGRAYTDDARQRLLQETAKDPQLHALVQVALGTVARAGELLSLTRAHVELGDTEGRLMFVDTKNGEARMSWLFGDALVEMRAHLGRLGMAVTTAENMTRPIFPGQWSHKHQKWGRYDYLPRLHKALAAAGLTMARPFHALRHTGATTMARMGANAHQLKAAGGWKSDAVNTYVHMAGQDTKALSQELAKRLAGPK